MISCTRTVGTARLACKRQRLHCGLVGFGCFGYLGRFGRRDDFAGFRRRVVDDFTHVEVGRMRGDGDGCTGRVCAGSDDAVTGFGTGMSEIGEAFGRVERDAEVAGKRGTQRGGTGIRVDLYISRALARSRQTKVIW